MLRAVPVRDLAVSFGPAVVVIGVATVALQQALVPARFEDVQPVLAGTLFAATALIALRFSRSRPFLVTAILGGLYLLFTGQLPRWIPDTPALLPAASVAVPTLILLAGVARERGVVSAPTLVRAAVLGASLVGFGRWVQLRGGDAAIWLRHPWIPELGVWGRPGAVLSGAAVLVLAALWMRGREPIVAGFAGAALAAGVAFVVPPDHAALYILGAVVIVLASLVETSYGLAFRDALTRLPSRRALDEDAQTLGRRYVVAMVDIDHFKKLNDRYGHDVGDQALAAVASVLAGVGGGGRAYRYGGEEFALVFPRRRLDAVLETVEALRQRVAARRIRARGTKASGARLSVTVSIGVAAAGPERRKFSQVLKAADKALYRAKRGGRNQVAS